MKNLKHTQKTYLTAIEEKNREWQGDASIFSKFDTITIMFKEVCLHDIFSIFQLDEFLEDKAFAEILRSRIIGQSSIGPAFKMLFKYNGLEFLCDVSYLKLEDDLLETYVDDLLAYCDYDKFFEFKFKAIRLNLTGSGLDYLRSNNVDVDDMFFKPLPYVKQENYHYTRMDVAFDMIDYAPDFIDKCRAACIESQDPNTLRVPVNGTSVCWRSMTGNQNTLYFGATTSDKLLRLYDKKMQFVQGGIFASKCPFKWGDALPRSWIRIELQARNIPTSQKIINCENFSNVFRFVYDSYAQRKVKARYDKSSTYDGIYPHWDELFDWQRLQGVIKKSNFVQFRAQFEKTESWIMNQALPGIQLMKAVYGEVGFNEMCNERWSDRQRSSMEYDVRAARRFENVVLETREYLGIKKGFLPYLDRDQNDQTFIIVGSKVHALKFFEKYREYKEACTSVGIYNISFAELDQLLLNYGIDG